MCNVITFVGLFQASELVENNSQAFSGFGMVQLSSSQPIRLSDIGRGVHLSNGFVARVRLLNPKRGAVWAGQCCWSNPNRLIHSDSCWGQTAWLPGQFAFLQSQKLEPWRPANREVLLFRAISHRMRGALAAPRERRSAGCGPSLPGPPARSPGTAAPQQTVGRWEKPVWLSESPSLEAQKVGVLVLSMLEVIFYWAKHPFGRGEWGWLQKRGKYVEG